METPGLGHNSEMARGNWIAVDRDLRYHEIIGFLHNDGTVRKGVVVCQTMAWIDLIMEANWKDRRENNNGKVVLVERGQLVGARAWLAKRWGWTENKVRWFLKKLEDNGMIARSSPKITQPVRGNHNQSNNHKRAHYANVITICNYDIYQTVYELDDLLDHRPNHQSTTNQPPHQNKGTREQDNYTEAREREPTNSDPIENLSERLCEAAGEAIDDPCNAPGLLMLSDPRRWIDNGCDLERDILPAIQARAAKARRRSIRSWAYFEQAVIEARDRRLAPMPDPVARAGPASNDWRDEARARTERAWAALEDDGDE